MDSPILLSAEFSVAPGATVGLADSSRLQNPSRTAMLLDEIRFLVFNSTVLAGIGGTCSGWLSVSLSLGRTPLTNGFVSVGLLGKQLNPAESLLYLNSVNVFSWRLPKPLYIPAGEYLVPAFQAASGIGTTARVRITYAGRALPSGHPQPEKVDIPWATAFVAPSRVTGTYLSQSTESQLVNPFNEGLKVQRFLGRITYGGDSSWETDNVVAGCSLGSRFTTVRMSNSNGEILVRDPTPFNHIFHTTDRAWTVNAFLPPKGFYLVDMNQDYATLMQDNFVRAMISMVGHREVALK